ncbi:MAG: hypothetical protein AAF282_16360 [Cyanobacteria bacterium P01_A01_bin.15]
MNFLKLLFNPIFLLAAGLHAGLLFIPIAGGSSEDVVPAPDPEGESITVTRIPPQQIQPMGSNPGPTAARPNPAVTATQTAAGSRTAARTGQQQRAQASRRRPQGGQPSNGGQVTPPDSNGRTQAARNSQTNGVGAPPGLPALPDNSEPSSMPAAAPEQSTPQAAPTLTALKDGAGSQTVPDLLKVFLARLRYGWLEARDVAAMEAKQAWLADLEKQPAIQVSAPEELAQPLSISYPLTVDHNGPREIRSCLNPLPMSGLIGVVVDTNGAIATAPTLLRSSGYDFLNDVALDRIQDYSEFPTGDSQQAYMVPVEIDYSEETCIDLADLKSTAASDR